MNLKTIYLTQCGTEVDVSWHIGAINSSHSRHCGKLLCLGLAT